MNGGASFGKTVGDIYARAPRRQVDLNNPNNTFRRGVVGNDVPWSYRVSGVYELPYQISSAGPRSTIRGSRTRRPSRSGTTPSPSRRARRC